MNKCVRAPRFIRYHAATGESIPEDISVKTSPFVPTGSPPGLFFQNKVSGFPRYFRENRQIGIFQINFHFCFYYKIADLSFNFCDVNGKFLSDRCV